MWKKIRRWHIERTEAKQSKARKKILKSIICYDWPKDLPGVTGAEIAYKEIRYTSELLLKEFDELRGITGFSKLDWDDKLKLYKKLTKVEDLVNDILDANQVHVNLYSEG